MRYFIVVLLIGFAGCGIVNAPCDQRTIGQCTAGNSCRVITAQPLSESGDCWLPPEPVRCASAVSENNQIEAAARDPDGRCWRFALSADVPDGWEVDSGCPVEDGNCADNASFEPSTGVDAGAD